MHKLYTSILFILFTSVASAQFVPDISQVWGGNSLDEAKDVALSPDSNHIFFGARTFSSDGSVPGNAGGSDFWLIKSDLAGNQLWNKTYGGFNNDDLSTVIPLADGGALVFGTSRNDHGEFGDLTGLAGAWLFRVNSAGVITRGKIFGGDISENGIDAVRHPNGNITMAIEASSPELNGELNNGVLDVWVVQVDANLNLRWTTLIGGSRQDSPGAITADFNGNVYIASASQSDLPGLNANAGEKDVWVVKLSPTGDILWQQNFGGSEDDVPTDILYDPDGDLYVMAHSSSQDGDFDENLGFSDLWLMKLDDATGDPVYMRSYGGAGIETGGNITFFGQHHFVISATSNSDSFDLSGNKGSSDVWLFTVDLFGNIKQEMNYGGSLNDQAGDVVMTDSIFYLLNTTLSNDKNVPANSTSQQDIWLFTLNTNPLPCSGQLLCLQDSTLGNEIFPPATEVLVCVAGCTAGLESGPDFIQGSCPDFIHATAYYKLTTDTTADLLTLSVSSNEFNEPHLALLRSTNCSTFTQVACAQGTNGYVLLQYIDIDPLREYIVAISDAAGHEGDFEFCASSVDVNFCNNRDNLYVNSTSMGSSLEGPFLPGELVQICYELEDWNKLDCNGFQGLVPTFGPGWDPEGFDSFGMPLQVDSMLMPFANGFWNWHQLGEVRYNVSNPISGYQGGQGMPPGWYFTNLSDPPPNNGPDQTTGDLTNCVSNNNMWKVCFTLPVEDECETSMDATISMRTFSDGELGVNTSLACAYDQPEVLNIGMVCCINPTVQNIPPLTYCSGDTIILNPNTNIIPPFTFSWTANPETGIEGATNGTELNQFYQILTNETDEIQSVFYTLWAEGISCVANPINFVINITPKPTSRITVQGPTTVCSGETVTLNFESTGTPPFAIQLVRDNQFFANVLSESTNLTIEIDPVLSGRFRVGSIHDAFCEGEGLGFVNVTVKPVGSNLLDTTICEGESIIFGAQVFSETGSYIINLPGEAQNNCDSIISLSLSISPTITEEISEEICTGDTLFVLGVPYTQTTQETIEFIGPAGCPAFIELDLMVRDTFTDEFSQTICGGDTLNFEGVALFESGTYEHVEQVSPGCFGRTVINLTVLPRIVINDISIQADNGHNGGAIIIEVTGGSPPLTYLWNTGQTQESLFGLAFGDYSLTVTDTRGCVDVFNFEVPLDTRVREPEHGGLLRIRPTLTESGSALIIMHTMGLNLNITDASWWNIDGKQVATSEIEFQSPAENQITVPLEMVSGLYFLRLSSADGTYSFHKVVVN